MSLKKQKINFTQVQNELLIRDDMDFGLKGLFTYIMSKPDGWEFSSYRIAKETKESDRTIKTMIKKLVDLGYISRTKHTSGKVTYEIFLYPECKKATVKNLHGDESSPLSNTEKKSNTEKEEKKSKDLIIPDFINRDLWLEFMLIRKKMKAQNTDTALKKLLNRLEGFEKKFSGDANLSIENSIINSWKGVFEPKKDFIKNQFPQPWLLKIELLRGGTVYADNKTGKVFNETGQEESSMICIDGSIEPR